MLSSSPGSVSDERGSQEQHPNVGDTVWVGAAQARGVVKFSGPTHFATGHWLGIELQEKTGKNDGMVQGRRYFECKPLHGLFVRSNAAWTAWSSGEALDKARTPTQSPASPSQQHFVAGAHRESERPRNAEAQDRAASSPPSQQHISAGAQKEPERGARDAEAHGRASPSRASQRHVSIVAHTELDGAKDPARLTGAAGGVHPAEQQIQRALACAREGQQSLLLELEGVRAAVMSLAKVVEAAEASARKAEEHCSDAAQRATDVSLLLQAATAATKARDEVPTPPLESPSSQLAAPLSSQEKEESAASPQSRTGSQEKDQKKGAAAQEAAAAEGAQPQEQQQARGGEDALLRELQSERLAWKEDLERRVDEAITGAVSRELREMASSLSSLAAAVAAACPATGEQAAACIQPGAQAALPALPLPGPLPLRAMRETVSRISPEKFEKITDTGDVLQFKSAGSVDGQFDHVGLVLKLLGGKIGFLEATEDEGVSVVTWQTFVARERHKLYTEICLRKCRFARNPDMLGRLQAWASHVLGKPYGLTFTKLLRRKSDLEDMGTGPDEDFFSSELVADGLKVLGVFPRGKSSTQYWPSSFSAQLGPLECTEGSSFDAEDLAIDFTLGDVAKREAEAVAVGEGFTDDHVGDHRLSVHQDEDDCDEDEDLDRQLSGALSEDSSGLHDVIGVSGRQSGEEVRADAAAAS